MTRCRQCDDTQELFTAGDWRPCEHCLTPAELAAAKLWPSPATLRTEPAKEEKIWLA